MRTAILCAIGMAGKLSRDEAIIAANAIKKAVADVEGDKFIILHVLGFDDDPRELWEVREFCRYAQIFLSRMKFRTLTQLRAWSGGSHNDWIFTCAALSQGRAEKVAQDADGSAFLIQGEK